MSVKSLLLYLLLFFHLSLTAQNELRFESVKSSNKLSQRSVTYILQDKCGFIWIATYSGLNKYDGYKYTTYNLNEGKRNKNISSNHITSIREDKAGFIWVNTFEDKIHRFDPRTEKFISFPNNPDNVQGISCKMFEFPGNVIWIVTNKVGAYYIKTDSVGNHIFIKHIENLEGKPPVLTSNNTRFVVQDSTGNYWIGTDKGLNRIQTRTADTSWFRIQKFTSFPGLQHQPIGFSNAVGVGKYTWFATAQNGILLYNSQSGTFSPILHSDIKDAAIKILQKKNKKVWITTNRGKLLCYDIKTNTFRNYSFHTTSALPNIRNLFFDSFNQLWINSDNMGITRIDITSGQCFRYDITIHQKTPVVILEEDLFWFEDSHKNLWIGTQNMGLALFDRGGNRYSTFLNDPQNPESIASNTISCILEDREGLLWLGLGGFGTGINIIHQMNPAFRFFKPQQKPSNKIDNSVRAVLDDSNNSLWVATKDGNIHIYDHNFTLKHVINNTNNKTAPAYNVYSIFEDSKSYVWLCTKGAGLYRSSSPILPGTDYRRIQFIHFTPQPNNRNSISHNFVYDIREDRNGNFWIATFGNGLDRLTILPDQTYRFARFNIRNSNIPADRVRCLSMDHKGNLWVGTTQGLSYIRTTDLNNDKITFHNQFANPNESTSLSYNDIMDIMDDDKGTLWVGTNGGGLNKLERFEKDKPVFHHYNVSNGLCNDMAYAITTDATGNIWITTDQGISRLNPANNKFENFDEKNGLPAINFSEETSTKTHDGNLVFGCLDGFYVVYPELIKRKKQTPTVYFTSFQLFNREVLPGEKDSPLLQSIAFTQNVTLQYNQSVFAFEFSSLSYKDPENNLYSYQLEGFENHWTFANHDHKAVYTNIPPGKYTFRVKGSNSDGVWNNHNTSTIITILPPAWKTIPAYIAYLVVVFLLLLVVIRIVLRIARLENNLAIEKKVVESKLRFFTNISHEFRTPLTLILGPVESMILRTDIPRDVRTQLKLVHRNSKRLLRLINQLLDFRKVQNEKMTLHVQEIKLIPFLRQIHQCYLGAAEQKNITFELQFDDDNLRIWGDFHKLDIVFFNLLSNAFKFTSDNQSITIGVTSIPDSQQVKITITDTGIGIQPEKLPYIFDRFFISHTDTNDKYAGTGIGLSLAMEYAKLHHGRIEVESTLGKGTSFMVYLSTNQHLFATDQLVKEKAEYTLPESQMEAIEIEEHETPVHTPTEKFTILVVEDDVDMSSYIANLLSNTYTVQTARDGVEGWNKATSLIPDLIITDVMMPRMDGIEFTKKVKDDYNTCHIPVIILTSRSEMKDQLISIDTGAEWYISKPFNEMILHSYVHTILLQRQKVREKFNNIIGLKPDEINVTSRDKVFFERVIKIIEDNIPDPDFSVEKLASQFEFSRTVFYKKLRTITGYQPVEFIRLLRLKRAAQLLATHQYNVSEVAFMTGFNDLRYFSLCFKKQFDSLPSKYEVENEKSQAADTSSSG